MKYIYFTTPLKASIIEWDGISIEPQHIARFDFLGSYYADRYILNDTTLVDKYVGMTDSEAMIADLGIISPNPPITPQGNISPPVINTNVII
jgi:hypothetical protein